MNILNRKFFARNPVEVARDMIGTYIVRRYGGDLLVGKIVETEAYLAEGDTASHGYKPKSNRTESLFGPAGYAYVTNVHRYFIMNVVTEAVNQPSAVLIRAIEPVEGIEVMKRLRGKDNLVDIGSGPGKVCIALGIDRSCDGISVTSSDSDIYFLPRSTKENLDIGSSARIGISSAQDYLFRFFLKANPHVSGPTPLR